MRCCSRTIWNNFHTELRSRVTLQFSGQSDDEVEVDYSKNCVVGWRIEINLSVLGGTRLCRKLHSRPHYYNDRPHMSDSQALVRHGPGIISQSSPCQGSCASPHSPVKGPVHPLTFCQGSCVSPHSLSRVLCIPLTVLQLSGQMELRFLSVPSSSHNHSAHYFLFGLLFVVRKLIISPL